MEKIEKVKDEILKNICKEIKQSYENKTEQEMEVILKKDFIRIDYTLENNPLQIDVEFKKINDKEFQILIFIDDNSGSRSFIPYSYSDVFKIK